MNIPQQAIILNWRNEQNKSGLYSIHLRITIDRVSKYYKIPIPQKVSVDQWHGRDDMWVKNHPFAFEINQKILEKKALINDLIKRSYLYNKTIGFDTVFQVLKKKAGTKTFYEYMEQFIANPPERLEENTIKKYNTCLVHLREFKRILYFSDIDNQFLKGFYKFLQTKKNLQGSSCKKYMEALKRIIRQAMKEQYLDSNQMQFLFDDVKIKVNEAKRVFLDPKEIKQWRSVQFSMEQKHLARDRDLFLFQIYTAYYYNDLKQFLKTQLLEDPEFGNYIIGERDKNGNQTIIPLFKFPHAAAILNKYQASTLQANVFDPSLFIEEQKYNENLKKIAKLAKITKNVSNKVARHTNAQLWIRYGAERPILSKMMGHKKEETTKAYFSVNLPEIVEGVKRVDFSTLEI